jgi:two-component system sensor histidine kinase DctS
VLINLVRNAADALMGHRPEHPRVNVTVVCAGPRFVRVAVEDNGPGLAGRDIRQLSEPFFSTKRDGMGMGLAICRSVIEAHHGAMEAGRSALGGAAVSFTLLVFPIDAESEDKQREQHVK